MTLCLFYCLFDGEESQTHNSCHGEHYVKTNRKYTKKSFAFGFAPICCSPLLSLSPSLFSSLSHATFHSKCLVIFFPPNYLFTINHSFYNCSLHLLLLPPLNLSITLSSSSFHHPLLFSRGIYRVAPDASASLLRWSLAYACFRLGSHPSSFSFSDHLLLSCRQTLFRRIHLPLKFTPPSTPPPMTLLPYSGCQPVCCLPGLSPSEAFPIQHACLVLPTKGPLTKNATIVL